MNDKKKDRTMFISEAAAYVTPYFRPARCSTESTHLYTTDEVYASIIRLNPSTKVTPSDVFLMLEQNGFLYEPNSNALSLEYKWLLVRIQ